MTDTISIQCLCGSVHLELSGEPAARANCHCGTCRDFYGTPMLSATAWPEAAVRITKGEAATFAHSAKQLSRAYCVGCGETLFGINRLDMRVVPNSLVVRASGGVLPVDLSPTMHLFYRHRIIDVSDALTKYLDGWDGPEFLVE